jgi:hypothetical protein
MANIYTYEVLKDTTQKAVIKLTANFDGSGQENNVSRIQANSLYGALATNGYLLANNQGGVANTALPYYGITISRIGYNIASQQKGYVELFWSATNPANNVPIFNMDLCGQYSEEQGMVTIQNNAVGATGDIGVMSVGLVANCAYTLIVELRKDNAYYQRGQFNDPAAFNAGPYSIKP